MKIIDINSWDRNSVYQNFINYDTPILSITTRLNVNKLVKFCKKTKSSFFINFLFAVMHAINNVDALKLRFDGENVVLYDMVGAGFVVLKDNGVITTVRAPKTFDYKEFYNGVKQDIKSTQKGDVNADFGGDDKKDVFYVTAVKWVDFTSINNPYDFKDKEGSSIPRIAWGKMVRERGKWTMPFDIACHHALVDGYPVCEFINKLQELINQPKELLK